MANSLEPYILGGKPKIMVSCHVFFLLIQPIDYPHIALLDAQSTMLYSIVKPPSILCAHFSPQKTVHTLL